MTPDAALLLDLLATQHNAINRDISEMPEALLHWRPDPEANSIALTLWHLARIADFMNTVGLKGQPQEAQAWFTSGWAQATGYDPRGAGLNGTGLLAGYSQQDVAQVPRLTGDELLAYFNEGFEAIMDHLEEMPAGDLERSVPYLEGTKSVYHWYKITLIDNARHFGEIQALRAMWERRTRVEPAPRPGATSGNGQTPEISSPLSQA